MLVESYSERQHRVKYKQDMLLKFLRDETWSNAEILALRLNLSPTAVYKTLRRLVSLDFIKYYYVRELKFKIWGITAKGLLYSWSDDEQMEDRPLFESSKIKPVMIQHHLDLQLARLNAENLGWGHWKLGNQLPKGLAKRPDAVVHSVHGNKKIAVELERTIKTKKRYEVIFSIYLQTIKKGDYDFVHYVCPDREFSVRLKRLFQLINSVPVAGTRVQITDKHRARFPVYTLADWPCETLL